VKPFLTSAVVLALLTLDGFAQTNSSTAAEIRTDMSRAQAALRDHRPDVAVSAYKEVLRLDPGNIDARANLGVVAMSTGDWRGAANELDAALRVQPSQSNVEALLGICEVRLGRAGDAEKHLSEAFSKVEEPKLKRETGMNLVEVEFHRGELDKASAILIPLKELDPTDVGISYAAFRVYSELAYQAIESLAINSPDSAQLHRALAEHLVNDGHIDGAITEYRKALTITPDTADVHFELGQAIEAQSQVDSNLAQAQQEFEASLRLNPANASCECQLAEVELLRSDPKDATQHFMQALHLDPEAACAKAGLAPQLMDEGKEQQALQYLEEAVRDDPYNPTFHYRLAALYRKLGDRDGTAKETAAFKELRDAQDGLQRALHPKLAPE
jgi:tetratricopeptide (TPR) repeat protein